MSPEEVLAILSRKMQEGIATVGGQAAQVARHAAQVAQNAAQVAEDKVAAGESKKQALEAAERLKDSADLVQKNTVDLKGKAPVIIGSATSYDGTPVEVKDSAEMQLQGLRLYGKSKQVTTTGANLFDANDVSKGYVSDDSGSNIVVANSYCSNFITVSAKTKYYLYSGQDGGRWGAFYDSSKTFILGIEPDKYNTVFETPENAAYIRFTVDYHNNNPDFANNVIFAKSAVKLPFEPYTGGKPSPSPEYPQEIVSVGGNGSIEVNVRGKNLADIYGYSANGMDNPEEKRVLNNEYGTTLSTTEKTDKLIVNQEILDGAIADNYTSGYFCIGINRKFEVNKYYIITFRINVIRNPLSMSEVLVSFNGITFSRAKVIGDKVTVKVEYKELGKRQYVEVRNNGMSVELSDFMITEVGETDDYVPYTEQTVQLHHILNAIPVASGTSGITYTDADGQAWIADEIDFSRGKYIQRVWQAEFDGSEDEKWKKVATNYIYIECLPVAMNSRKGVCSQYIVGDDTRGIRIGNGNATLIIFGDFSDENALSNFKANLSANPFKVMTYLDTPIETDLTQEQLQAYKSLTTFKPTSIISNDANAQMEVEYAADTKAYIDNKLQEIAQALVASASEAE